MHICLVQLPTFDRFFRVPAYKKFLFSRCGKFNHVKYTKTLSMRNYRIEFSHAFSQQAARHAEFAGRSERVDPIACGEKGPPSKPCASK
jgi:replication initiation and membrane attachment protein DnaB